VQYTAHFVAKLWAFLVRNGKRRGGKAGSRKNKVPKELVQRLGGRRAGHLVRALGEQRRQHHQVGQAEQPLIGAGAGGFRGSRDEAQMTALGEIVDVFDANAGEARYFRIGEDFLARFYGDHGSWPFLNQGLQVQTLKSWTALTAYSIYLV